MGRKIKYPQLLEINIGQSILIPRSQIGCVQTVRNIVYRLGLREGLAFTVRDDPSEPHVEVARVARTAEESGVTVCETTFVTYYVSPEERRRSYRERMDEILAKLNADEE